MGRRKLTIRRLEGKKERQTTFSKRKSGLLKKATELSILCEVDLALIMFSPGGNLSHALGHSTDMTNMLQNLSGMSIKDREERRRHTLKALKKKCSVAGFSVDMGSTRDEEPANIQHQELKGKLAKKKRMLSDWENPEQINDMTRLRMMEDHLITMISGLKEKEAQLQLEEQQRATGTSQVTGDC